MSKLYFKQLQAGIDFAIGNEAAHGMENFVYLIGDEEKKECVVIDPAWDIDGIIKIAQKSGMKIVGALATHYHPDHVGGNIFGFTIEGLSDLMAKNPCPIHAHTLEKEGIIKVTKLSQKDIIAHTSGDIVKVGDIEIKLLHTPGHTPGSLCFCVDNFLVSGDTLFLNSCGRVDLPGGNVEDMYNTLYNKFSKISDDTIIYPGHAYGGSHEPLGQIKSHSKVFKHFDMASFKQYFNKF